MTNRDNKIANILVTFRFPDDSNFTDDVDSEIIVKNKIAKVMRQLVKDGKIFHFVIGTDDVISEKLSR